MNPYLIRYVILNVIAVSFTLLSWLLDRWTKVRSLGIRHKDMIITYSVFTEPVAIAFIAWSIGLFYGHIISIVAASELASIFVLVFEYRHHRWVESHLGFLLGWKGTDTG